jgi:teichuronic acid biosynthesis glycosyltransferase TuaC
MDLVHFHPSCVASPWMRVLFITSMWPDTARPHYGTFIRTQAQSLEDLDIAIDVLSIRGYASFRSYLTALGRIRTVRTQTRYDLLHVHTGHAAAVSTWAMRGPSIISYVGGDLLGNPGDDGKVMLKSRLEATVFRQFAWASTCTITKSREMEKALPRSLQARNHVIPNGVNLDAFAPRPRAEARAQLGWDQDESVVLFLGDPDDPRKNVALARGAVEEAQRQRPEMRLHIGWGSRPEEIPRLMWAADALAFTSRSEGSPNVVKEAMAAALPIVATPVGDVPERLADVEGCYVINPDPTSFGNALIAALAHERAPAAREAVQELGLSKIANRVATLYEQLTGITRPSQQQNMSDVPTASTITS